MTSQDLANGKTSSVGKKSVERKIAARKLERKFKPGDITWVKSRGGLWWPAQVVDENLVSESSKPDKRSIGNVLVRLYGTYTYSYVNPDKWCSEFDAILKQNNGSYKEIFMKSLEQDVARVTAGGSNKQRSKSKGNKQDEAQQPKDSSQKKMKSSTQSTKHDGRDESRKNLKKNSERRKNKCDYQSTKDNDFNLTPKPDEALKKRKLNSSSPETMSCAKSQELSTRRIRVMQSLGLVAPPGSPFCRNGQFYVTL